MKIWYVFFYMSASVSLSCFAMEQGVVPQSKVCNKKFSCSQFYELVEVFSTSGVLELKDRLDLLLGLASRMGAKQIDCLRVIEERISAPTIMAVSRISLDGSASIEDLVAAEEQFDRFKGVSFALLNLLSGYINYFHTELVGNLNEIKGLRETINAFEDAPNLVENISLFSMVEATNKQEAQKTEKYAELVGRMKEFGAAFRARHGLGMDATVELICLLIRHECKLFDHY